MIFSNNDDCALISCDKVLIDVDILAICLPFALLFYELEEQKEKSWGKFVHKIMILMRVEMKFNRFCGINVTEKPIDNLNGKRIHYIVADASELKSK